MKVRRSAAAGAPAASAGHAAPAASNGNAHREAAPSAPPAAVGPQDGPGAMEVSQTAGPISATFQVARTADGVAIRYRITNGGDADVAIKPAGVLVRINGSLAPYAMARANADRMRPELLPRGATETGVIQASGKTPRSVQVTLSLFPISSGSQPAGIAVPWTFEPLFSQVDRLPLSTIP